jgi:peptide chain release factor 1
LDATRRSQIGSGERSEKIRTYNYPDSRVTDHRVKVTVNLEKVLGGDLEDFTEALTAEDRRRALEAAAV